MKVLIVTSEVTFAPENYNTLINGIAISPHVTGLVVLRNKSWRLFCKALLLVFAAPRTGLSLLRNCLGPTNRSRITCYGQLGKPVLFERTINAERVLRFIKANGIDLVVNARTRCFFGQAALSAPTLGCINIHHGLLPDQRGTVCDLWALHNGESAGFSIHLMTPKLDDGDILERIVVSDGSDQNFQEYLRKSANAELRVLRDLLENIAITKTLKGTPNRGTEKQTMHRDPSLLQLWRINRSNVKI